MDLIQIREIQKGDTFVECGMSAHMLALKVTQTNDRAEVVARVIKGDEILLEGQIVNYMQKFTYSAYAPQVYLRSRIEGLMVIQGGK